MTSSGRADPLEGGEGRGSRFGEERGSWPDPPMVTPLSGPSCRNCAKTEQRCAYLGGCCGRCSHWVGYTVDGNPRTPYVRREHATERGYWQHRYRMEMACDGCKAAHAEAERSR